MNLTKLSIANPVAVIASVLLVLLMGTIGLTSLPVQMIPDVQRPFIQITTGWRSAAPEEVESVLMTYLPDDGEISYYGSADDLNIALASMSRSFALAIAVLYLLMSGLFRSFADSLLVLAALALATVGGVALLRLMSLPMDLLTMIGFITLLGLVVNNAILLVHQARSAEREGLDRRSAVEQAMRRRLRPILMSTMTSLFGMFVSTVFTLIFLPSMLRLGGTLSVAAVPPMSGPAPVLS